MSQPQFRGPPPIGEALSAGWNAYKANFSPVIIGTLCGMVCGFVPVIGQFIARAGIHNVSLKAVRGIKPEANDGFIGFKKIVDCILIGLLQACGVLACIIGLIVTQPLFLPGSYFLFDKDVTWSVAKDMCMERVKPHLMQWIIFHFVMGLVAMLLAMVGVLMCCVGVIITVPIVNCAMAYAYDYSFCQHELPGTAESTEIQPS